MSGAPATDGISRKAFLMGGGLIAAAAAGGAAAQAPPPPAAYGAFRHLAIARAPNGVVEMRLHTDGGPFVLTLEAYDELREAFNAIGADPAARVLILTGTGDWFIKDVDFATFGDLSSSLGWSLVASKGRRMVQSCIDFDLPVVAAINGPIPLHSELAFLADVVVSVDDAWFQDPHMNGGAAPGDGIHACWMELLGVNRARTFLMLGTKLSAREAKDIGVIAELTPHGQSVARARAIADGLAEKSPVTLRNARAVLTRRLSRALAEGMAYGWPLEEQSGLAGAIKR